MFKRLVIFSLMTLTAGILFAQEISREVKVTLSSDVPAIFTVNHEIANATEDAQEKLVSISLPPKRSAVIKVEAKGYQTQWRTITPTVGENRTETFELLPLEVPCLFTSPNGKVARLSLRGREVGKTPCYVFLEAGKKHVIKADAEGYHDELLTINTIDGRAKFVSVNLKPSSATLVLNSSPIEAEVLVNGISYGETPVVRDRLKPGVYTIAFSAPGYKTTETCVEIAEGEEKNVSVALEPLAASLRVVTLPEDARVYVDGVYRGQSNLTLSNLEAEVTNVSVEKVGYTKNSQQLILESGEEGFVEFRLEKVMTSVTFKLSPAEVDVYINRKHYTTTTPAKKGSYISSPITIDLPIGKHTLAFSAKNYFTKEVNIILQENKQLDLGQIALEFKPNILVTLKDGKKYKGALIEEKSDTLRIMTRPGTIIPLLIKNIEKRELINVPTVD